MLDVISPEILAIIGTVVSLVVTFIIGRSSGKNKGRAEQAEKDLNAAMRRKEKDDEVEGLDGDDRDERLRKWVRPPR